MVRTIIDDTVFQGIPHLIPTNCQSVNMKVDRAIFEEVALTQEWIDTHSIQPHSDGSNQIISNMHNKNREDDGTIPIPESINYVITALLDNFN